jgi:hypothetical protein
MYYLHYAPKIALLLTGGFIDKNRIKNVGNNFG